MSLLDELALPAPSLSIEQADAHNVRGRVLQAQDTRAALAEYRQALAIYESRWRHHTAHSATRVHERYQEFLLNLARFSRESPDPAVRVLLLRAVNGYLELAQVSLASDRVEDTRVFLENLSTLLPELSEQDRTTISQPLRSLEERLAARK